MGEDFVSGVDGGGQQQHSLSLCHFAIHPLLAEFFEANRGLIAASRAKQEFPEHHREIGGM